MIDIFNFFNAKPDILTPDKTTGYLQVRGMISSKGFLVLLFL